MGEDVIYGDATSEKRHNISYLPIDDRRRHLWRRCTAGSHLWGAD